MRSSKRQQKSELGRERKSCPAEPASKAHPCLLNVLWRPKSGRGQPLGQMRAGLCLPGFLSVASCIAPDGSSLASSRNRFASSARRSSRDLSCLRRRRCSCTAGAPCLSRTGARSVSLSPIKCHELHGDGFILRLAVGKEQCASAHRAKEIPRQGTLRL